MREITCCFCVFPPRSELWRLSPGPKWHHREPRVPPRLSQLCQLYLDYHHRRAQQDTAVISHICSRRGLRYSISLRRAAPTRESKSEVMYSTPFYHPRSLLKGLDQPNCNQCMNVIIRQENGIERESWVWMCVCVFSVLKSSLVVVFRFI